MTTELKAQLTLILNEAESFVLNSFFGSEFGGTYFSDPEAYTEVNNTLGNLGISAEHQTNHGGEGEGDSFWSVYKFTQGEVTVFVKFDGSYQSYNGSEYDSWYFVEPKEVTVTEYFKVK